MEHINRAQQFYNTVVSSGKISSFAEFLAITIFASIDSTYTSNVNVEAYVLTGPNQYTIVQTLISGSTIVATSGDVNITWAPDGEMLLNCRQFLAIYSPVV